MSVGDQLEVARRVCSVAECSVVITITEIQAQHRALHFVAQSY